MKMHTLMLAAALAVPAHAAGAESLRCPATVAGANALIASLRQTSMVAAEAPLMVDGMYLGGGSTEKRMFDGGRLTVLGVRPDKVEVSYFKPGVPSSIHFWVPGQDRTRYAAAFVQVAPPLKYPCDGKSSCWWSPDTRPPVGTLETVELADSIFEKKHVRFTCGYRSY